MIAGLGLYSLAKRMDAVGGRYGVKKRNDGEKGSVFWFEVPYRPDETAKSALAVIEEHPVPIAVAGPKVEAATANSVSRPPPIQIAPSISPAVSMLTDPQRKFTVLLVDDSLPIVKMIMMMLTQKGHSVQSAVNGEIALSMLQKQWEIDQQHGYDVVLMDLQMPVMDGLEATRRWRELEAEYVAEGAADGDDADSEDGLEGQVCPKPEADDISVVSLANESLNSKNKGGTAVTPSSKMRKLFSTLPGLVVPFRSVVGTPTANGMTRNNNEDDPHAAQLISVKTDEDDPPELRFSRLSESSRTLDLRAHPGGNSNLSHGSQQPRNQEAIDLVNKYKPTKKPRRTRHQLIIGMSANSDNDTMEDAFKAGVDDFIKKPFSVDIFLTAVWKQLTAISEE
jgi:CheY-like chemotaxis protein